MAGDEAELLIEAPRIGARLVGGELHHLAAVTAAFLDRPFEHAPAEAAAAARRRDAHALDLAAPEADARQAGNEAQLQAADDLAALLHHGEELIAVGVDGGEGGRVARVERRPRVLTGLAEFVVGEQRDDGRNIGRGGAVVMINTMAARKIPPLGEAGYAASKAALANSVKWLAKELGPKGIRVNSVHMGWMWGAPVEGYINWQSQESKIPVDTLKAQIAADIPLGQIPTDDDCAKAALFMVSDYAAAVTGAALDANGGAFMP